MHASKRNKKEESGYTPNLCPDDEMRCVMHVQQYSSTYIYTGNVY